MNFLLHQCVAVLIYILSPTPTDPPLKRPNQVPCRNLKVKIALNMLKCIFWIIISILTAMVLGSNF
jgi:hypothetical protein